jgi:hypothetical protein
MPAVRFVRDASFQGLHGLSAKQEPTMNTRLDAFCLAPLTACIASLLGLAAATPVCASTTHTISSCDDGVSAAATPGTLRYEIMHAAPTDAIDVTGIPTVCGASYITLYSGEIPITQSTLAIYGSGKEAIRTIHGRLFKHTGTGTLSISALTIESGYYAATYGTKDADGGCIYSAGNVTLTNASVIDCEARVYKPTGGSPRARGGGIFAKGHVTLTGSSVSGNLVDTQYVGPPASAVSASGGGIYAGSVSAYYSTISGNVASYSSGLAGCFGGGVFTTGGLSATHSTIADNRSVGAGSRAGGAYVAGALTLDSSTVSNNQALVSGGIRQVSASYYDTIINSTISGNQSGAQVGGMSLSSPALISNSTIAFNVGGPTGGVAAANLTLRSSIIADNIAAPGEVSDLRATSVTGTANLVMSTDAAPPFGVITLSSEPQLTPLAYHGGPTLTHALLANSPAIAAGSNPTNYPYDQRGLGFDRTLSIPPPAALTWTDIGAYQRQLVDDEIFYGGFGPLPGG